MGKRSMENTVAKFTQGIPARYELTLNEMWVLHSIMEKDANGWFESHLMAFKYGFVLGARAYQTGKVRGGVFNPDLDVNDETDITISEIVNMSEQLPILDLYKVHNLLTELTEATDNQCNRKDS